MEGSSPPVEYWVTSLIVLAENWIYLQDCKLVHLIQKWYFRGWTSIKSAFPSKSLRELSQDSTTPIHALTYIVPIDITARLGLDVLDGERPYADIVTNRLVHRHVLSRTGEQLQYEYLWSVPRIWHQGHSYARMDFLQCTFYTTAQLKKSNRRFAHPSADKLYRLLRITGLEAVDSSTVEEIDRIVAECEPGRRIKNGALRFIVSLSHANIRFNAKAYIDIVYLGWHLVLHIVDEATRFRQLVSYRRLLPVPSGMQYFYVGPEFSAVFLTR